MKYESALVKAPTKSKFEELEQAINEDFTPKFKVGDRIAVCRSHRYDNHIGVCEVIRIYPNNDIAVQDLTLDQSYMFNTRNPPEVRLMPEGIIRSKSKKRKEEQETQNVEQNVEAESATDE